MKYKYTPIGLARLLIALVIAWNLQAALAFLLTPTAFTPAFELSGIPGTTALRAIAILFIMWNVPYLVACWQPARHLISLKEALVMQSTGLLGETALFFNLPSGHAALGGSILRFIAFDAAGVAALSIAFWLVRRHMARVEP